VPQLERALLSLDQISNLFFCILYPFSAGIAIANLVYPSAAFSTALTASAAMIGYVMLAWVAGRWSLETVKRISHGTGVKIARVAAKDFSIKTRNPVLGYVMKDLKISSRNPATAFFFALPVLETVIVSLLITNYAMLRASTILVATAMGGIFALLMPLALLNAEGPGLEYTKTLPVNANRIITSKTLISTATYVPVPLTLLGMAFMKQLTSPLTILIPYITIMAIASASIFEIKLFLSSATKGKIAALIHDLEKLIAGVIITLIPEVAYATTFFISFDHVLAILIMGGTAVAELAMAVYLLKRS
jgi:predicted permease